MSREIVCPEYARPCAIEGGIAGREEGQEQGQHHADGGAQGRDVAPGRRGPPPVVARDIGDGMAHFPFMLVTDGAGARPSPELASR